ncbi:MAG: PDZ domain-containing protein [Planctomycetota bacterium]
MKTAAIVTALAFAAGALLGALARRAAAAPQIEATQAVDPAAAAPSAAARSELPEFKAAVPASPAAPAPPTVAELRARFDKLAAARDGEGLLQLIRDCQAAGPHAYPLALEIGVLIENDSRHGPRTLGLNYRHSDRLYWGGLYFAASWALAHPEGLSDEVMAYAVWTTGRGAESKRPGALQLLLAYIESAPAGENRKQAAGFLYSATKDSAPEIQAFIRRHPDEPAMVDPLVSSLIWQGNPEADALIEELARTPRDEKATISLLDLAGHRASDSAVALLNGFASDPRPAVQEEARFQLIRARPPVQGNLVEKCDPAGKAHAAGLRRGDIVTAWNGVEFSTQDELRKAQKPTIRDTKASFPVVVLRGCEKVTLTVTWGEFHDGASSRFTRETK